jgi:hypothetical protein
MAPTARSGASSYRSPSAAAASALCTHASPNSRRDQNRTPASPPDGSHTGVSSVIEANACRASAAVPVSQAPHRAESAGAGT